MGISRITFKGVSDVSTDVGLSTPLPITDLALDIAAGNVAGKSIVFMTGENTAVGTSAFETIWPIGGEMALRTAAATLNLSSASANDANPAGTGARTVFITGVDATFVEVSETVELNGQTAVATSNDYRYVNTMVVASVGSLLCNDGRIYASTGSLTAGVPAVANTYQVMEVNRSIHSGCFYCVPAGFTTFLTDVSVSVDVNQEALARFRTVAGGITFQTFPFSISNFVGATPTALAPFIAGTLVESQAIAIGSACELRASFSFIKVAD